MSHVFDDSEDEFEDDYTESIKVINEITTKIQKQQTVNDKLEMDGENEDDKSHLQLENNRKTPNEVQLPITYKAKSRTVALEQTISNSAVRTRSSNRLKNIADGKITEANITYDSNGTIEVLVEDIGDDEVEYVIAGSIDNEFDDEFQSAESNDGLNTLLVEDNDFDSDAFQLEGVTKSDEMYSSEESLDEKQIDEEGKLSICL